MSNTVTNRIVSPNSGRETFTFNGEITLDLLNGSPLIIWIGDRRIEVTVSAGTLLVTDSATAESTGA